MRPGAPKGGRLDWVLGPRAAAPQASSFWRRSLFDRFGPFREDLHYVFDTEFMLRLSLADLEPTVLDAELAVRYLHDEAKSADRRPFELEQRRIARDLTQRLTPREQLAFRLGYRVWGRRARAAGARVRRLVSGA